MSITAPEFSEILEEFIKKFGDGVIDTKSGKSMSNSEAYLQSIKAGIDHLVANTGPNGTITPAVLAGLITQHNNTGGNSPSPSGSPSGGSSGTPNPNNTILEDFGKAATDAKSKTSKAFEGLGKASASLKQTFRLLSESSAKLLTHLDNDNKMYGSLVTRGMAWSSSAVVMADNVNKAGFTVETFTKLLNEGSAGVKALGGNNFLHLASSVEKANSRLGDFGLGTEEYYRQLSTYTDYMRVSGDLQQLTNKNVGDSFHELMGKTIALTGAFGVSIDQFMKVKQELTTNQVDYSLVHGAAQRSGISDDEIRTRISMLTNRYGAEFANSTLRRLNGGTDANYAMNRESIDAATRYATAGNERDAYNRLNEVQSIGLRRANNDSGRINAVAGSYIQDTQFGRATFGTDTAFRNAQGMNHMSWEEYQRAQQNMMRPDALRDTSQGLPYGIESRNATTQGIDNHMLVDFQKSLGSALKIINNVYTEQYPNLAKSIDKVTDRFGKLDGAMSKFIDSHSGILGNIATGATAFNQVVTGTVVGAAGLAGGKALTGHITRRLRSRSRRPSTGTNNPHDPDETILEEGEGGPGGAGGGRRGLGRLSKIFTPERLSRAGRAARGTAGIGLALGAYDVYSTYSHENAELASGRENSYQAGQHKLEAWGKSIGGGIGGIMGAFGGSAVLPGVGTVAGGIAGGATGEALGDYIAKKSYSMIYGNSPISSIRPADNNHPPQQHSTNGVNNENIATQQHDSNHEQNLALTRIEQLLIQLNRTTTTMARNLGNISPYTSP